MMKATTTFASSAELRPPRISGRRIRITAHGAENATTTFSLRTTHERRPPHLPLDRERRGLSLTNCDFCDEELFDDYHARETIDGTSVYLCPDCRKKVEENHRITGKFVVDECPTCGNIRGVRFIKYKPRGRPKGYKENPATIARRKHLLTLDECVDAIKRGIP